MTKEIDVADAVWRLSQRLPLQERQRKLPSNLRALHRSILRSFAEQGRPPATAEIAQGLENKEVGSAVAKLAECDLVVQGGDGQIVGAYPFTLANTPHRMVIHGRHVNAMCAFDALGVGPMFGTEVLIESTCELTGEPLRIVQRAREVIEVKPSPHIHVGIRWNTGAGPAADTL